MQTQITEGFRLSPHQEHLWLIQQVDKTFQYRVQCAVLIEGNINIKVLKEALKNVVHQHEILRTTFRYLPGMTLPVQVIGDEIITWNDRYDFSSYNPQEQAVKIEALFQELIQLPFDWEKSPLLQTYLVTLSSEKHILILGLPAMNADAKTLNNLVYELSRSYAGCLLDEEASNEPLQYADIAEWYHELLEAEETKIGREYWRKQDISNLLNLTLPLEKQPGENAEFRPQVVTVTIDANLGSEIANLAQKNATSMSVFFLACWQVLLWRLTGQPDIAIATACEGRKYEELRAALGLFAKYLPLTSHLEEDFSFSQILQQVNRLQDEVYKWEDCFTWEQIVGSDGNGIGVPFCPFSFEFEAGSTQYSVENVSFSIYKKYACTERFKVKLSCGRQADTIAAEFHYNTNLFSAADIERLAGYFERLVTSAVANPEMAIGQLEILSDRHRQQLLIDFNHTQTNYPLDRCIHQLFEEQVKCTPDNIAVVFDNRQLTYQELNARANQLAHYLQQLGVKAEIMVGICIERSLEMLIGILGILKAGGAYIPLDPSYPQERLALMLEDAQTPILLTQHNLLEKLPDRNAQTVCLDRDGEIITTESETNPALSTYPENLAYIIYTSGSTGKPKGVQITHQNLVHSTRARMTYYQEPVTSFLLLSSFAFDSSVAGIFWTLCQGGTLYLPPDGLQKQPPKIVELIAEHRISHLLSLPSLYALILEQAKTEQLASLCTVIVAGEALSRELVKYHLGRLPKTSLFNEYGPTEATVWSSVYHCQSQELTTQIPIGRPIPNTKIYILDSFLQAVPIGVPGELYIGGIGLARGYLNRPDLTAEKFILNPFINSQKRRESDRLYKTGDLARYLPDGNIEFLGRIDHQVKIRGFRIEIGEIEAVLSQHQSVREAVVVAREDEPGNKRLVAYVIPTQETAISSLSSYLKEKLPDYMVPSAYVMLKNLPLTPNGKVDRKALPAPDKVRPDLTATFVEARTPIEKRLAEIWADVLSIQQVGIYDNFFELGGHSLLVTQVLARVRKSFSIDLSLGSIFEAPTVAGMAERIEMGMPTKSGFEISNKDAIAKCGVSRIALEDEAVLDPTIRPNNVLFELTAGADPSPTPPLQGEGLKGSPSGSPSDSPFPRREGGWGVRFSEFANSIATQPTAIFLTGVTGFLGAFLLYELLQQTEADIYCLVRSANITEAKQRIQNTLQSYLLWNEHLSSRIIPVVGDLSEPLLGLSEREFLVLAEQLDVIYHNGALVNFTYPYSALKAANVLGTEEILRLAAKIKLKPVHFISTTSVFSSSEVDEIRVVREADEIDKSELIHDGYSQSKWVAEKLVAIAASRGIPVSIYRPGRISGHSKTGVCNTNDHTFRTIKGCIQLGCAPNLDAMVNLTPVDYVSQAIAHLSKQQSSLGKAFHLINPHSVHWNELVNLVRSMGYPLKQISYSSWQAEMLNILDNSPENALYPLASTFLGNAGDRNSKAALQFDYQNTLNGLVETSITCAPVNTQLLSTYFSYLIRSGFLNAPTQEV